LEITHKLGIPSIMLTAHALTPDNLKRSVEQGADAYVPKDKMVDICEFLADVILARQCLSVLG
jgi:CheY-like chemotaxis protein